MALDGHLDVTVTGNAVEFVFTVENAGTGPVDLEFHSGQVADVAVLSDDEEIWRWSEGRMFTQALRTETLGPGESLTHEATWESSSPGAYVAKANLEASDRTLVERVEFEV